MAWGLLPRFSVSTTTFSETAVITMNGFFKALKLFALTAIPTSVIFAQSVIVSYTFNSETTTADVGSSISSISWNSGGSEGYASPFSGEGRALSVNNFQIGEYFEITLDATGYESITLDSFRTNGGVSAPTDWDVIYSTTGADGSFSSAMSYSIVSSTGTSDTEFSGFSLDSSANNNSSIVLRFIATSSDRIDGGVTLANGTVRMDSISISAVSAVPEPSTYAVFAGVAMLGFAAYRRRQRKGVATAA